MENINAYWQSCLEIIKESLNPTTYRAIFPHLKPVAIKDGVLILETDNELYRDMVHSCYNKFLNSTLLQLGGVSTFEVIVKNSENTQNNNTIMPLRNSNNLISRFTFDTFIVGSNNNFACASAMGVSEMPTKYNPLLIYGNSGLGKTHLLHAVGNRILELHPDWSVVYVTAEKFMNSFIDSIRTETNIEFRNKFRNIDVLLLDDIQFFAGKEGTQEEFFHTFNELITQNKQIMMTSDRPPKDINPLQERLKNRISSGLTTDIQPPNYETRLAILHQKAQAELLNKTIDDEIFDMVAQQIKSNIRELEGAIKTIIAFSNISKENINIETANKILSDYFDKSEKRRVDADFIIKEVEKKFDLSNDVIKSKKKDKNVVFPRHVAMYICRELTQMSLDSIGNEFGGRDHTTVMNAIKKIKGQMEENLNTMNLIKDLITSISSD